ncbi:transmembrane protein 179B-like isoform X2 [Coregonus clupeaformis]|nr:transmembrane protein 179B-like isoform X2 [Coregonus clupeaformis]
MLYGTVNHNLSSHSILVQTSSAPSLCSFVSSISVCVAVFSFLISLFWICTCFLTQDCNRTRLGLNVTLVLCGVFLFFLLVTGCVLKMGRDSLCDSVLHTVPNITRCEEAQSRTWISPYTGTQFYTGLYNAGTAVWVNLFLWILIGMLVVIQSGYGSDFGMMADDNLPTPSETEYIFHTDTHMGTHTHTRTPHCLTCSRMNEPYPVCVFPGRVCVSRERECYDEFLVLRSSRCKNLLRHSVEILFFIGSRTPVGSSNKRT